MVSYFSYSNESGGLSAYPNLLGKKGYVVVVVIRWPLCLQILKFFNLWVSHCISLHRMAVEKYPDNRMLGHREIVDGKVTALLCEQLLLHMKTPAIWCWLKDGLSCIIGWRIRLEDIQGGF